MIISMLLMAAAPSLSAAEEAAAFKAAGFTRKGAIWRTDCDQDPSTAGYGPGKIDQVVDLNRDGRPEAVITEGGLYCYGNTATGFMLVSKQANGRWVLLHQSQGIPRFLPRRVNGWPELEVGGPGFCFPVLRWNGKAFANHRMEYEGKACRR
jgi:hypothetical protein